MNAIYSALKAFLLDLGLDPENLTVEAQECFARKLGNSSRDEAVWSVLQMLLRCSWACREGRAMEAGFFLGTAFTKLDVLREAFRKKRGSASAYKVARSASKLVNDCASQINPEWKLYLDTGWHRPGETDFPPVAVVRVINL